MNSQITLLLCMFLIACQRDEAGTAATTKAAGPIPKLHPDACSTIPVATGTATATWAVRPTGEDIESPETFSTTAIETAADGTWWLVDRYAAKVIHLDASGKKLGEWGKAGQGPGEFKRASAIALAPDNTIVVGDGDGRITVFREDGTVVRTLRPRIETGGRISDLLALPNNQLVLALNVMLEGAEGTPKTYVAIVDSVGNLVKRVLQTTITREFQRPLVAHMSNDVRLTRLKGDRFAVWYPLDNYVDVIDVTGRKIASVVGCFPQRNEASYSAQRKAGSYSQSAQTLTAGVEVLNDTTIQIFSLHLKDSRKMLRARIYTLNQGEVSARDHDIVATQYSNRVEVIGAASLIAYSDQLREAGVARIDLR